MKRLTDGTLNRLDAIVGRVNDALVGADDFLQSLFDVSHDLVVGEVAPPHSLRKMRAASREVRKRIAASTARANSALDAYDALLDKLG